MARYAGSSSKLMLIYEQIGARSIIKNNCSYGIRGLDELKMHVHFKKRQKRGPKTQKRGQVHAKTGAGPE